MTSHPTVLLLIIQWCGYCDKNDEITSITFPLVSGSRWRWCEPDRWWWVSNPYQRIGEGRGGVNVEEVRRWEWCCSKAVVDLLTLLRSTSNLFLNISFSSLFSPHPFSAEINSTFDWMASTWDMTYNIDRDELYIGWHRPTSQHESPLPHHLSTKNRLCLLLAPCTVRPYRCVVICTCSPV